MPDVVRDTLYAAVKYALDRAQTNADFGYQCGPGNESFRLLCIAEAAHIGKSFEEVEAARSKSFDSHRPRVVEYRERIEELEAQLG